MTHCLLARVKQILRFANNRKFREKFATSIINLSFLVASAAVHSKAVVLLLLIHYLLLQPLFA